MRQLNRKQNRVFHCAVAAASVMATGSSLLAASGTWQNTASDGDATWSNATLNWSASPPPGNTNINTTGTDHATLSSVAIGSIEIPILDTNRRLSTLNIDNSGASYNINKSGTVTLATGSMTISGGGTTTFQPTLYVQSDQRWDTGTTAVTLAGGFVWANASNLTLTLINSVAIVSQGTVKAAASGSIIFSGAGSMTITGDIGNGPSGNSTIESAAAYTGTIRLSGNNSFGGNITWRRGTLSLDSASAAGVSSGTPNMSMGTNTAGAGNATIVQTGAYTVTRSLLINTSAQNTSLIIGGTNTSGTATYSGAFNLNNRGTTGIQFTAAAGGTVDFSGEISNNSGAFTTINKVGAGTVRLTNATGNTYAGRTTVTAGTLLITNTSGSGVGTSIGNSVQVLSSGRFGGTGIATVPVTVAGNATLLAGDGVTAGNDLALAGDLVLQNNSSLQFTLGNGGAHSTLTRSGGTWTFDSDQAVSLLTAGEITPQFYDGLITGLAGDPGTVGAWQITNPFLTGTFTYDSANNEVDLTITSAPEPGSLSLLALGGFALLRRRRAVPSKRI